MSNKDDTRNECLSEILSEHGVHASWPQIEKISKDFAFHLEMESEMSSYQYAGSVKKRECDCDSLKEKIRSLEYELNLYKKGLENQLGGVDTVIKGGKIIKDWR